MPKPKPPRHLSTLLFGRNRNAHAKHSSHANHAGHRPPPGPRADHHRAGVGLAGVRPHGPQRLPSARPVPHPRIAFSSQPRVLRQPPPPPLSLLQVPLRRHATRLMGSRPRPEHPRRRRGSLPTPRYPHPLAHFTRASDSHHLDTPLARVK